MKVELVDIGRAIPYARNPRRNEMAIAKVAASIKEYGFRQPIVVDEEMVIIAGHTRLQAAQQLGLKKIPVHIATGLTPVQVKAYRLADNRTHEDSQWDEELLAIELDSTLVDSFGGSGTTLIACEKLKRQARMIELDPIYCDVIVKRWQEFTGKEAVSADGKSFNSLVAADPRLKDEGEQLVK